MAISSQDKKIIITATWLNARSHVAFLKNSHGNAKQSVIGSNGVIGGRNSHLGQTQAAARPKWAIRRTPTNIHYLSKIRHHWWS